MKKFFKSISLMLVMLLLSAGLNVPAMALMSNASNTSNAGTMSFDYEKVTYPYEYKDDTGKVIVIEKEPERIVSLSPTMTEIVFAFEGGSKIVGRTDYCDFPAETAKIPSVGSMTEPSIEKIVAMKPDLVLASFLKAEVVEQIEKAGVKVIQIKSGDSFEGSYKNMQTIAALINKQEKAKEVLMGIDEKINSIKEKVKDAKPVTAYYVAGFGEYGDYTAGDKTFINDIITAAGGDNVAKDAEGWKYTSEKLVEKNPEIIFIGQMAKLKDSFIVTAPYKDLDSVKNNKVFEVDDNLINREGPRMAEAVEMLAKLFHPELFK